MKTSHRLLRLVCAVSTLALVHCGTANMGNDASTDVPVTDTPATDARTDATGDTTDARTDAGTDGALDASPDGARDGGPTDGARDGAPVDAPSEAGDARTDGGNDASDTGAMCTGNAQCDDSNACTTDQCNNGQCTHTAVSTDDSNACTMDACDPTAGVTHTPVPTDDNNVCTVDSCDPTTGVAHMPVATDDGNACTLDSCDPTTGVAHTPIPTDDSNVCTVDSCDPTTGVAHMPVPTDDGNACTLDSCDPTTGVAHTPIPTDDGNACTLDACDPASGVVHVPVSPDDGVACTVDSCDSTSGSISHMPSNAACEIDGFSCTVPACDATSGCSETPSNAACDDGIACTIDSCAGAGGAPGTGCSNASTDVLCPPTQVCRAGGCIAATSTDQAGHVIITEFSTLGTEFIEIYNTTSAPIDVHGYVITNNTGVAQDIRAATDPQNTMGTAVILNPGASITGVPTPRRGGSVPAGVNFVFGAEGTTFTLGDTSDIISLYTLQGGSLEDYVDYTGRFATDPNQPVAADAIPGSPTASTQLDPTALTASGNDAGANWCTSFFPASGTRTRVSNTYSAPNGSCSVAVINEVLIDSAGADDGNTFLEIAGPGGGQIGGARIRDVEGKGTSAGSANAASATLPIGQRIPSDGILIVADGITATPTITNVPNVTASDLIVPNVDFENSGGDSIQLVSAAGTLLDVVGDDPTGAPLDRNSDTVLSLAMYETATALYPPTASTLARVDVSTDTDNNRADFHVDPSPTPGAFNDTVALRLTALLPNNGLATQATPVVITGNDFATGVTAQFGAGLATTCTVVSPTRMNCTAPSSSVGRVNVTVTDPASVGVPSATLVNGYTYTGVMNETNVPNEVDYCILQFPSTVSTRGGTATPLIYGRIFETGVTEPAGASPTVIAEVGYGPFNTNPANAATWLFFPTTFNQQYGNDDEYQGTLTPPAVATTTTYAYTYRFSLDGGLNYTYCDSDGAGSNPGFTFSSTLLGTMTVTP